MAPFAKAILEVGQSPMKFFPQISNENAHNIQTHNVDMALLDRSLTHQAQMDETEAPLDLTSQLVCLLEPPSPPTQATERDYSTGSDLADPPHDSEMAPNSDIAESNALSASVRPPFLGNAGLESESEEDMDQQQRACS
ncbi:hypothetical protein EGW08_010535 [Elysia chlorotica]|uniref:Uncharacterized protein n=1 Tax=Elysia chlorotica TaxID=188477 RepID=A0A3S1C376_ELYCH|nr:hypothetical protein EGW08_010535 [Elysia chlorotica]